MQHSLNTPQEETQPGRIDSVRYQEAARNARLTIMRAKSDRQAIGFRAPSTTKKSHAAKGKADG